MTTLREGRQRALPTPITRIVLVGIEHSRLGGVAGFMNTMAHGFLGRGYAVSIIGMKPTPIDSQIAFERDPRIQIHTIYDAEPPPWVALGRKGRLDPRKVARHRVWERSRRQAIDRLRPMVEQWGPETMVICTQIYAMEHLVPAGLQTGRRDSPYVITQYHGSREGSVRQKSIRRLRRWYADADRLIALTQEDARQFQRLDGMNNTGWIPNPIAPPRIIEAPLRRNEVVSLNRYSPEKSLDWLIRAWAVLAPEFPEWTLRLYGEGPLRPSLAALITNLDLDGVVFLEGTTSEPEMALLGSKIYALTSQHEGLPLTIAEAAQAGVPTVCFDCCPGIRALIDDEEDGLVVPPNQLALLIESLRRLMADDELRQRMGARARERSARFALDTILDLWEGQFRTLAGGAEKEPHLSR